MHIRATQTDRQRKPLVLVRLLQNAELRRRYVAQIPWWRRSPLGYLLAIPFVGLGLLLVMVSQHFLPRFYFLGTPMTLAVLLVALIWGVGPALFCAFLSTLALGYFYVFPASQFDLGSLDSLLEMLPFLICGIGIAVIAGQREHARRRALFAEQAVLDHTHELEQLNQQLEDANQLKDRFISMASHELKTPITTIRGHAQVTLRRLTKQADLAPEQVAVKNSLEKINSQTYRLTALVEDLLELSSIQTGKVKLRLQNCDLVELCHGVINDQQLLTERQILLEAPTTPVKIKADANRLSQVITNLISNALKYSPDSCPVQITVCQEDHNARVQVHDAGPGIPKDQQTHIFEAFYRTPDAQKSPQDGWGLGLAICKDIVERHGGHIWCESQPGSGTTFIVELPTN